MRSNQPLPATALQHLVRASHRPRASTMQCAACPACLCVCGTSVDQYVACKMIVKLTHSQHTSQNDYDKDTGYNNMLASGLASVHDEKRRVNHRGTYQQQCSRFRSLSLTLSPFPRPLTHSLNQSLPSAPDKFRHLCSSCDKPRSQARLKSPDQADVRPYTSCDDTLC